MSNPAPLEAKILRRTVLAGLVLGPLALSACSSSGTDTVARKNKSPEAVSGSIDLWYPLDSIDKKSVATYQRIYIEPFAAEYPKVDVHSNPQIGDGLDQKLQTALAAGQGPDILPLGSTGFTIPLAQAGYVADLGPLAKSEHWDQTFLPWALDVGVVDGKLVCLPVSYETLCIFYNKTLFRRHGWKPPSSRAELEALAADMQAVGVIPFTNANADYHGATEHLVSGFLNMVAGPRKIHDALTGAIPWTDPTIVSSLQLMIDYFEKGWFSGGVKQYLSTSDPEKYSALANGDAGMFLSGTWEIEALNQYFPKSGSDWDWAPLPSLSSDVPNGFFPLSVGDIIGINAATHNLAAAVAYLTWRLTDVDARWKAIKELGDEPLPVRFDPKSAPKGIDPRFISQYAAISQASEKKMVGYVTWTSLGASAEAYLLENEDKLLTGDLTAADFCSAVNQAFQKDLKKKEIPPVWATSV
jgi:raffinose/stachyose/melibiose transport system substrate-binding protein